MDLAIYLSLVSFLSVNLILILEILAYSIINRNDQLRELKQTKGYKNPLRFYLLYSFIFWISLLSIGILLVFNVRIEFLFLSPLPSNQIIYPLLSIVLFISGILLLFANYDFINLASKKYKIYYLFLFFSTFAILTADVIIIIPLAFSSEIPTLNLVLFNVLILIGLLSSIYSYFSVSSLSEAIKSFLVKDLLVAKSNGDLIYSRSFQQPRKFEEKSEDDESLLTSSIVGLEGLLKEISASESVLKTLVYREQILMVQKSENFIVIFNTHKELESLREILIHILHESEIKKEFTDNDKKALSDWFDDDLKRIRFIHRILHIQRP